MLSKYSFLRRSTALFLSLVMLLGLLPAPVRAEAAEDDRDLVIVSMGDSYSSGEGIEPFYHEKPSDLSNLSELLYYTPTEDWLAHRSTKAWGGQLVLGDILMSEHRYDPLDPVSDPHWFFVASSGAESRHIEKPQLKLNTVDGSLYLADFNEIQTTLANADQLPDDIPHIPAQINVFDTLDSLGLKADYVTLTLGGNDVGFADVVAEAAVTADFLIYNRQKNLTDDLNTKVERFWIDYAPGLQNAYLKILDRAGKQAHLIVAGYPLLFSEDNFLNEKLFELFSFAARRAVNIAVNAFNQKIQILVSNINEIPEYQGRISFVSVAKAFNRHGAYAADEPFINPVQFTIHYQDLNSGYENPISMWSNLMTKLLGTSAYSMHPNENGAKVYAKCVQEKIQELEALHGHEASVNSAEGDDLKDTEEANHEFRLVEYSVGNRVPSSEDLEVGHVWGKLYEYFEIYDKQAATAPLCDFYLKWDDFYSAPEITSTQKGNSLLIQFTHEVDSVGLLYNGDTGELIELPEGMKWYFAGNYLIGQMLKGDIRNDISIYIYDNSGTLVKFMDHVEMGELIGDLFYYGDASMCWENIEKYAFDDTAQFEYKVYTFNVVTGETLLVCTYTMNYPAIAPAYSYIMLTGNGLVILRDYSEDGTSKSYSFPYTDMEITFTETKQSVSDQTLHLSARLSSPAILDSNVPIYYAGSENSAHSYYEVYDTDTTKTLAGLVLYWDEDMNEGRGAPTLSYVASETSVLVSFSCAPYSTSAIFDTTTNLWNELPENLSWSFGGNYFIGQSLSTDIHSTSYSTFIYDICGKPFMEMHNMEYGQIIEYMGKPYFIYGDATSYSRVDDPYDPESTFSYDIYGIDLETGNITSVCSYTMYCSLWYFYLIQLTKDGLCIYDMDLQQTAVYDFTGGTINER